LVLLNVDFIRKLNSGVKGGKWGQIAQSAGLEGTPTHFASIFKEFFKLKINQNILKIAESAECSASRPCCFTLLCAEISPLYLNNFISGGRI